MTSSKEKVQIATVSAHNDASIGALVAEALEKVGSEGIVSVEEAKATETSLEIVEGMQFDRGFLSPYFVTDPEKMEAVLEEPLILLHEKRIGVMKDLVPVLEEVLKAGRPLLIIAEEIEGEALATLVVNKLRGALACAAVKAPGFGDRRKAMLEDLAILTGGEVIAEELGLKLAGVTQKDLGRAKRVVIDKDTTTIIGGAGQKSAIAGSLRGAAPPDRRHDVGLRSREARRAPRQALGRRRRDPGGRAVRSGDEEPQGRLRRRDQLHQGCDRRGDRARRRSLAAARARGGRARGSRVATATSAPVSACSRTRSRCPRARSASTRAAMAASWSTGCDTAAGISDSMRATGEYKDLVEAGIIDPTKVVRLGLENAVSVASTLLLAEATLTEIEEKPAAQAAGPELG